MLTKPSTTDTPKQRSAAACHRVAECSGISGKVLSEWVAEYSRIRTRKEQNLKLFNTTDVQAEVLVFDVIKPCDIVAVVFDSILAEKENNLEYIGDREIEIHTNNGLFSSRDYFNRFYKQTPVQFGAGLDSEIPF